jgi:hypothetical protein
MHILALITAFALLTPILSVTLTCKVGNIHCQRRPGGLSIKLFQCVRRKGAPKRTRPMAHGEVTSVRRIGIITSASTEVGWTPREYLENVWEG